jgi:hypothetical protein
MIKLKITDAKLRETAGEGIDAFFELIVNTLKEAIGGELTAENMAEMSSEQITLMGYSTLRDEVMDGGFIQMIYNGYGPFYFKNPFDAAMRNWGLIELCRLMRRVKKQYLRYKEEIEHEMSDDDFMALYEQMPVFDDFDDEFVSNEEQWTAEVAHHIDENLDKLGVEII